MMKFKVLVLTLRAVALLFAVGFVAVKGGGYLASRFGLTIDPYTYFAATLICVCVTLWLSTRALVSELRLMATVERKRNVDLDLLGGKSNIESVHKYPRRVGYLFLALTMLGSFLPYIYPNTKGSALLTLFTICLFLFVGTATAIYFFKYKIYLFKDKITVSSFVRREYMLSDVSSVSVVKGRDGLWALVSMKCGKIVRFRALLNNFDDLVVALKSHAHND